MTRCRYSLVIGGLVGVALALPTCASAQTYTVVACNAAPRLVNHAFAFVSSTTLLRGETNCDGRTSMSPGTRGGSDGLIVRSRILASEVYRGQGALWRFTAPAGTTITRLVWSGAGRTFATKGNTGWAAHLTSSNNPHLLGCSAGRRCLFELSSPRAFAINNARSVAVGISCVYTDCAVKQNGAPTAQADMYSAEVTVNDPSRPVLSASGSVWGIPSTHWISATANPASPWQLSFSARDPGGPCELQAVIDSSAGQPVGEQSAYDIKPDYTEAAPCGRSYRPARPWAPNLAALPGGTYYLHVQATNPAGALSEDTEALHLDNQPPTLQLASNPTQATSHWVGHAVNFQIIAADQPGLSGVADVDYQIDARAWRASPQSIASFRVNGTGTHTVRAYATDNAGNTSAEQQATVLIDETPPQGVFEPISTVNPRRLVVDVADAESGVATGDIELEINGRWQSIPTRLNASRTQLIGFVNDDTLPRGTWPARAVVYDEVGNAKVVNALPDGTAMVVPIPIRIQTRMLAGHATKQERVCHAVRHKIKHGPLTPVASSASRLVISCTTKLVPANLGRPLELRYAEGGRIPGLLETINGQPLSDARVVVVSRPPGWPAIHVATLRTNSRGRFAYPLRSGPSRILTLEFPGDNELHDSSTSITIEVRGASIFRSSARSIKAGHRLVLYGRVLGGYIPPGGKIIQISYWTGDSGWLPYETVYTQHSGRWRLPWRTDPRAAGLTYKFKVTLLRQADWPFLKATTSSIRVKYR